MGATGYQLLWGLSALGHSLRTIRRDSLHSGCVQSFATHCLSQDNLCGIDSRSSYKLWRVRFVNRCGLDGDLAARAKADFERLAGCNASVEFCCESSGSKVAYAFICHYNNCLSRRQKGPLCSALWQNSAPQLAAEYQ